MNQYDLEFEKIINNSNLYSIRMPPKFDYKLSEDFIRKYEEYLCWYEISMYQYLSEEFIREFSDKVDWHHISCKQKFSKDCIKKFSDKIYFKHIPLCYFKLKHEKFWKTFF